MSIIRIKSLDSRLGPPKMDTLHFATCVRIPHKNTGQSSCCCCRPESKNQCISCEWNNERPARYSFAIACSSNNSDGVIQGLYCSQ